MHLTPSGLRTLLRSTGFEPLRTEHMVWEHNPAGMWMALLTRAGLAPGLAFHLLKRNAEPRGRDLVGLATGLVLAPAALALEALAASRGRGGTILTVARRTAPDA